VGDAVEVLEELFAFGFGEAVPDLLEDEFVAVGDDAGDEGGVEEGDVVFWVRGGYFGRRRGRPVRP
jgi:hypothetical protein